MWPMGMLALIDVPATPVVGCVLPTQRTALSPNKRERESMLSERRERERERENRRELID
jgi:hypothetical protein